MGLKGVKQLIYMRHTFGWKTKDSLCLWGDMDVPLQNEVLNINWSSKVKAHLISAELLQKGDIFK